MSLRDWLRGAAHIFDFGGFLAPRREDILTDREAIAADWRVVGSDFRVALDHWQHPPVCDGCGEVHALFFRQSDGRWLCPICDPP